MRGLVASLIAGLLTSGCSVFGIRTTPEPAYSVERTLGAVEIRDYGARLAADTVVPGDLYGARNEGFRRLAGYIFGGNSGKKSIEMTAPVAQSPGREIAMTAPVGQAQAEPGGWRIRFFMPAGETLQTLPAPSDSRVQLVAVPGERVAVLRYSGIASDAAVRDAQARLTRTLAESKIATEGAPFSWFYDPPWTLPPLRRNEAVVRLPPLGQ